MSEQERGNARRAWILAGLLVCGAVAVCGGVVALFVVPIFQQQARQTKATEAVATMESTTLAVEQHYDLKRTAPVEESIPGVGRELKSSERVPVGGDKVEVDPSELSESERDLWKKLNWPSSKTDMYFQYTYHAEKTDDGVRAVVEARADFVEGGPMHTVTQEITVRDGELEVGERTKSHALE